MDHKIKSLDEIQGILESVRKTGKTIVQCHGVFDLLHPGHIRHLQEARKQGDILIVTVTSDRFVNKGPGRPAFNEELRTQTLAALAQIDFVVLNHAPDAVNTIRRIRPDIYVKGVEYREHSKDVTGKIAEETRAVESQGGRMYYTDDIVFSSSSLINRYFDPPSPEAALFIEKLKNSYSLEELTDKIESLASLNVLVIGDAILDEYQYVQPLGQSGKGIHMTARCLEKEVFLGGSLIIANHIAQLAGSVTLVTAVGHNCAHQTFIKQNLHPHIRTVFTFLQDEMTLTKKRYVVKESQQLSKLFETYSQPEHPLNEAQTASIVNFIEKNTCNYDLVLACDFGNGFTNPAIIKALSNVPQFLAVNTQTNSGNRGFNVVTQYHRADFISLNELELRLAAHDRHNDLSTAMQTVANRLHCSYLTVTRGVNGVLCYEQEKDFFEVPALTTAIVDRVGAGDSYFASASLCLAKGYSLDVAGFIGSLAAGIDVQIIGNRKPVHKSALLKYLTRLMK